MPKVAENMAKVFRNQYEKALKSLQSDGESSTQKEPFVEKAKSKAQTGSPRAVKSTISQGKGVAAGGGSEGVPVPEKGSRSSRDKDISAPSSTVSSTAAPASSGSRGVQTKTVAPLPGFRPKCDKILRSLMGMKGAVWLREPVDLLLYSQYATCVPNQMDFSTIKAKLSDGQGPGAGGADGSHRPYTNHNEFALDVRRVMGNFLRYQ